ncbi:MAG TPA: alpha-L-fucosidase [Opitutaceae bacterium]
MIIPICARFAWFMSVLLLLAWSRPSASAAEAATDGSLNKAERLERFRDLGFGLFIHWGLDSQIGSVISHSMVGASDDYLQRFIEELPRTFNPRKFQPEDWAALAKLAGIRYVVFTAKHHSGFCMWPTATTPYSLKATPFRRDITREILDAFRAQGIAPGLYFSPDDFWWLHQNGKLIQRRSPDVYPANNPGLMAHDQAQVRELLTNYGPIDVIFFDGPHEGLRELAWQLQPETVVTRGAIFTPEQVVPGVPLDVAWEACLTMGTQWQYKPTNETYKTGGQVISLLIETRAKGGNLLLNIGPKPDGEIPIEQEERLREVALWMFVNSECIYGVRPWVITNEGDVWFTKQKDANTVYAIVKTPQRWPFGEWRELTLKSLRATEKTEVSVLGQNDRALEYRSDVTPKTTWKQTGDGLHLRAMHAQRLYNNRQWPNPVVLKITNVEPAFVAPQVETLRPVYDPATKTARVSGALRKLGDSTTLEVGFEYRDITGLDLTERHSSWSATPFAAKNAVGEFTHSLSGLKSGHTYDVRAVVKHPLLVLYGEEQQLAVP